MGNFEDQVQGYTEKDDWQTPPDIVTAIDQAVDGITTDPSAQEQTDIGREYNYTFDDDGLSQPWYGTCFVNPPFSQKERFLEKIVEEYQEDRVDEIIVLTPDSTDTVSWWHKYIAPHASYVCFHEGRIAYYDDGTRVSNNVPFGTAISVFTTDEPPRDLLELLDNWGHLVETVSLSCQTKISSHS